MAFVSPQTWYHYLTWMLPAAVALLSATLGMRGARVRGAALAGLAILCALTFVNVPEPPPMLMGLLLWLVCTGVLLTQVIAQPAYRRALPVPAGAQAGALLAPIAAEN